MNAIQNNLSPVVITKSKIMRNLLSQIDKSRDKDCSILLIGETGVGKEVIAEYIHRNSSRSNNSFIKISLSAMPAELIESELFGHEKGAFTNAYKEKTGLFEHAQSGSILLDDIDDVPMQIQTKLLRALESRKIVKIGGVKQIDINVRVISASKYDLKGLVDKGQFRSDLYYRLNVVPMNIPPLRERKDDIKPLIEYFLKHYIPGKKIKIEGIALKAMLNYKWPGNVRELKNVIQRISIFSKSTIKYNDLPLEIQKENPIDFVIHSCTKCVGDGKKDFNQMMSCFEHNLIKDALIKTNGNQLQASKNLKLSPTTFRDKLKKHNISK